MKLSLQRVAEFTAATGEFDPAAVAEGYSIDSRTVKPGELFFAVKGERLDGHDFVAQALAAGAVAAVVSRAKVSEFSARSRLLVVEDTLAALQALAASARRTWGGPLVAVTGSTGKTTTKEAIAALLSLKFRVMKSEGNLNNHFGLPLQLLRLEPEHQVAVVELAMSHRGEIAALGRISRPDLGVVTNVAPVHLGFFASVAEIARAKYELIESLPASGVAVLNADDEYVSRFGRDFAGRVVTFALNHPADVRAEAVEDLGLRGSRFEVVAGGARCSASLPLLGRHSIYNALAAVAVALERGIPLDDIARALASLQAGEKRGQVLELAGATVVNDCYNSNPRALDAMVDTLAGISARRRIVVAGEMLELGSSAAELHRRCGAHLAQAGIDVLIGVRGNAEHIVAGARAAGVEASFLTTPEEAGEWLAREVVAGDVVLLKASRGVRLEKALEVWQARREAAATTG
ncbi:MAG TPA: UDP-N-acetylmuramoyl-tripeptide--D-alanyl-D-alanine ligase [Terriglobales bacterium]|nr:UDP-N-acetylmuramoyl-tripeptide--D-alanyl-D-alanine ligase [Terriglobales bacterium]